MYCWLSPGKSSREPELSTESMKTLRSVPVRRILEPERSGEKKLGRELIEWISEWQVSWMFVCASVGKSRRGFTRGG